MKVGTIQQIYRLPSNSKGHDVAVLASHAQQEIRRVATILKVKAGYRMTRRDREAAQRIRARHVNPRNNTRRRAFWFFQTSRL